MISQFNCMSAASMGTDMSTTGHLIWPLWEKFLDVVRVTTDQRGKKNVYGYTYFWRVLPWTLVSQPEMPTAPGVTWKVDAGYW